MIDKYQTCVFSTTCDSPTDAISDCLNVDYVHKHFIVTSFYLVVDSLGFFGMTTVNIFLSINKIVLTSLDEYFSTAVSNG